MRYTLVAANLVLLLFSFLAFSLAKSNIELVIALIMAIAALTNSFIAYKKIEPDTGCTRAIYLSSALENFLLLFLFLVQLNRSLESSVNQCVLWIVLSAPCLCGVVHFFRHYKMGGQLFGKHEFEAPPTSGLTSYFQYKLYVVLVLFVLGVILFVEEKVNHHMARFKTLRWEYLLQALFCTSFGYYFVCLEL